LPKTTLRKIKSPINTAFRTALGAFRTTPIDNVLYEARADPLEDRRDLLTTKIIKSLINAKNSTIIKILKSYRPPKRPQYKSTIDRIIENSKAHDLPLKQATQRAQTTPPWNTDM